MDSQGCINIDSVPLDVQIKWLEEDKHEVIEGYVYGLKMVSAEYQDMFECNTYRPGETYHFFDSNDPCNCFAQMEGDPCAGLHTAGLWSHIYNRESLKKSKLNQRLNMWITVRYPVGQVFSAGNELKGRIMEVVRYGTEWD